MCRAVEVSPVVVIERGPAAASRPVHVDSGTFRRLSLSPQHALSRLIT